MCCTGKSEIYENVDFSYMFDACLAYMFDSLRLYLLVFLYMFIIYPIFRISPYLFLIFLHILGQDSTGYIGQAGPDRTGQDRTGKETAEQQSGRATEHAHVDAWTKVCGTHPQAHILS